MQVLRLLNFEEARPLELRRIDGGNDRSAPPCRALTIDDAIADDRQVRTVLKCEHTANIVAPRPGCDDERKRWRKPVRVGGGGQLLA